MSFHLTWFDCRGSVWFIDTSVDSEESWFEGVGLAWVDMSEVDKLDLELMILRSQSDYASESLRVLWQDELALSTLAHILRQGTRVYTRLGGRATKSTTSPPPRRASTGCEPIGKWRVHREASLNHHRTELNWQQHWKTWNVLLSVLTFPCTKA